MTPTHDRDCAEEGKSAVRIAVWKDGQLLWAPAAALCLPAGYDANSSRGRKEAADAAVDFYEHFASGGSDDPPATVQIGTVIQGTLRPGDLIGAFLDELDRLAPGNANDIRREFDRVIRSRAWDGEEGDALLESLFDALGDLAPEGIYFGAHWGDGADFGWWPAEDTD